MSFIPYSAFDPIFWLHHANIDRIVAMWQAIYPDSFVTPQVDQYGTYTTAPGSTEDINTPLTPFHSGNSGNFYTAATARTTRSFGYTYPEIVDWNVTAPQLSSNVRRALNQLYNPSGSLSTRSLLPHQHLTLQKSNSSGTPSNKMEDEDGTFDYSINIRVSKSALNVSFFIHFFFSDPPDSPEDWSYAPNLIGTQSILATPLSSLGSSASKSSITYGQVPLTHALKKNLPSIAFQHYTSIAVNKTNSIPTTYETNDHSASTSSISPDKRPHPLIPKGLSPFLRTHLTWRVQLFDDTPVPLSQHPSTTDTYSPSPIPSYTHHGLKTSNLTPHEDASIHAPVLPSLKIFVVAREIKEEADVGGIPASADSKGTGSTGDKLPVYGEWEVVRGVTCGMVGGLAAQEGG